MATDPDTDLTSRRHFLRRCVAGGAALAFSAGITADAPDAGTPGTTSIDTAVSDAVVPGTDVTPQKLASDETFWNRVRQLYPLPDSLIHLEHGNWGMMSGAVMTHYEQETRRVNQYTSYYGRQDFAGEQAAVMQQLALWLNVAPSELVLVRNATEALSSLISGYNRLRAGDSVLYADLDYSSMQGLMNSLRERRNVTVETLNIPEPATRESILDVYEAALQANPRIRLVLLTHISHRTGLLLPIAELSELATRYGADVIVDSAHAIGQVDFTLPDLKADFVGLNLHKWVGAPLGLGLMYVRKERFMDIDRHPVRGGGTGSDSNLHDRVGVGTSNLAATLSIPKALELHLAIGAQHKQARLRWLRDRWAETLRADSRFEILTPPDPALYAGITSFRLRGQTDSASNIELARRLLHDHRIFTVQRDGIHSGSCVRVTPAPFNSAEEMDALTEALRRIA